MSYNASWGFVEGRNTPPYSSISSKSKKINNSLVRIQLDQNSFFSAKKEQHLTILEITNKDVEHCSSWCLSRYLMRSQVGCWAYPLDRRRVIYYNGQRPLDFKAIRKHIGFTVVEQVTLPEDMHDQNRHVNDANHKYHFLLSSLANQIMNSGYSRMNIDHESDYCFGKESLQNPSDVHVLCIDNLVLQGNGESAFLRVTAYVFHKEILDLSIMPTPSVTMYFDERNLDSIFIIQSVQKSSSSTPCPLLTPLDVANRTRGYQLYAPENHKQLTLYWYLRAGINISNTTELLTVREVHQAGNAGSSSFCPRDEIYPASLFARSFTPRASQTRLQAKEIMENLLSVLADARFVSNVRIHEVAEACSDRGGPKSTIFRTARSLKQDNAESSFHDHQEDLLHREGIKRAITSMDMSGSKRKVDQDYASDDSLDLSVSDDEL